MGGRAVRLADRRLAWDDWVWRVQGVYWHRSAVCGDERSLSSTRGRGVWRRRGEHVERPLRMISETDGCCAPTVARAGDYRHEVKWCGVLSVARFFGTPLSRKRVARLLRVDGEVASNNSRKSWGVQKPDQANWSDFSLAEVVLSARFLLGPERPRRSIKGVEEPIDDFEDGALFSGRQVGQPLEQLQEPRRAASSTIDGREILLTRKDR